MRESLADAEALALVLEQVRDLLVVDLEEGALAHVGLVLVT